VKPDILLLHLQSKAQHSKLSEFSDYRPFSWQPKSYFSPINSVLDAASLRETSRLVNKSLLKEAIKAFAFKTNKRYDYFNKHLTGVVLILKGICMRCGYPASRAIENE